MTTFPLFLEDCGLATPLGRGKEKVANALFSGDQTGFVRRDDLVPEHSVHVGMFRGELQPVLPHVRDLDNRNNRLMQTALTDIAPVVEDAIQRYGRDRIAVVLGTSTSGIADSEQDFAFYQRMGHWPSPHPYNALELGNLSKFAARFFGLTGPAYTLATACSSSAKVFASARRLINADLADAAIVGGADTICRMTLNGFHALELLSENICNPFSRNRNGITIGEGASAFLLSKNESPVQFLGAGESSDAHHLTAPDPQGNGACLAMNQALKDAHLKPNDIAYINLHGTATPLNDAMESQAVFSLFGSHTPCSSTKGMTGHMLGATGGCEAAFMWLSLHPQYNKGLLPPHLWDGQYDPLLPPLAFVVPGTSLPQQTPLAMLSNSFGFGGSNASLIFGRT